MNVHPAFDAYPAIAAKIAARRDDPRPLSATLDDIDAEVWADLLDRHPLAPYATERQPTTTAAAGALPAAR
jgi:hypothetical protein